MRITDWNSAVVRAAAREAGDAGFDVLIAWAFNYDAHFSEFNKLGRIPVLKARMNADLHMADDLKNTGKGNLFVIFSEPDIEILPVPGGQIQVKVNGVDVFHPNTGEVRSDGAEGIACWFIDTDYNLESFFVRHAYFLGANDPYKALKTTLKAKINEEAWSTLNSDTSRPFNKPESRRIRQAHTKPPKARPGSCYFAWWFKCPSCRAMYLVEAARRFFDTTGDRADSKAGCRLMDTD